MPEPETELHYDSPFHLLIAVILSAQCTDKRVNIVTPQLFEAYPTAADMADAHPDEIYSFIKSVTFPNNKTKALLNASKMLVEQYQGEVPSNLDDLVKLPGVGRKTANVMLSVIWGKAAMAVDTHVFRVSNRLGLTKNSTSPLQTEKTLVRYIPEEHLAKAHHWLILHGRYVCKARNPLCLECGLKSMCLHYSNIMKKASTTVKTTK